MYLWCQEISLVLVWTQVYIDHESQTPVGTAGRNQSDSDPSFCKDPKMGSHFGSIRVHLSLSPRRNHGNADAMSRLPLQEESISLPVPKEVVLLMELFQDSPASVADIRKATSRHPVLSHAWNYMQHIQVYRK